MFETYFIQFVRWLLSNNWITDHDGGCCDFAEGQSARLGLFHFLILSLRSMDNERAYIGIRAIPWPKLIAGRWRLGRRDIGFQVCRGADRTEQTGIHTIWFEANAKRLPLRKRVVEQFSNYLFALVLQLITSRWAHDIEGQHTAWEESCTAKIHPLCLESNNAFVLDHADVYIGLRFPFLYRSDGRWQWNWLNVGVRACQGDEQVRQAGLEMGWIRPFSNRLPLRNTSTNDIPF